MATCLRPRRYCSLLVSETRHLTITERLAIAYAAAFARSLAAALDAGPDDQAAVVAITLKLATLRGLDRWVRVLIAKAALERPAYSTDGALALMYAAEAACAKLAA